MTKMKLCGLFRPCDIDAANELKPEYRLGTKIKPEMEWCADGIVMITMMLPTDKRTAEFAALEFGKKMNLEDIEVISREVMHESEGTRIEMKGRVPFDIDLNNLVIPEEPRSSGRAASALYH